MVVVVVVGPGKIIFRDGELLCEDDEEELPWEFLPLLLLPPLPPACWISLIRVFAADEDDDDELPLGGGYLELCCC